MIDGQRRDGRRESPKNNTNNSNKQSNPKVYFPPAKTKMVLGITVNGILHPPTETYLSCPALVPVDRQRKWMTTMGRMVHHRKCYYEPVNTCTEPVREWWTMWTTPTVVDWLACDVETRWMGKRKWMSKRLSSSQDDASSRKSTFSSSFYDSCGPIWSTTVEGEYSRRFLNRRRVHLSLWMWWLWFVLGNSVKLLASFCLLWASRTTTMVMMIDDDDLGCRPLHCVEAYLDARDDVDADHNSWPKNNKLPPSCRINSFCSVQTRKKR